GKVELAVAIIAHEIVGDRVFPRAIERTGAAPGIADLGVPARPAIDAIEELDHQEPRFARHRCRSLSSRRRPGSTWHPLASCKVDPRLRRMTTYLLTRPSVQ